METRELSSPPSMAPLYARAMAPMVPGASRLPFVAGGGTQIPELELVLRDRGVDREHLAAYSRVCNFGLRDELPPTYPHVLAFPLHMAVMTDGKFPFPAVGLVHIENRITQHRKIRQSDRLTISVHPTEAKPHPKGRQFAMISRVHVDDELVWEGESTFLRMGGGDEDAKREE